MKTFVIMIAKTFMKSHPRAGDDTNFAQKIWKGQPRRREDGYWTIYHSHPHQLKSGAWQFPIEWRDSWADTVPKLHTLREGYDLWASRAEQVNSGRAVLSLRQWSGKPYRSKQLEIIRLTKIGVQRIDIKWRMIDQPNRWKVVPEINSMVQDVEQLAKNDGLSLLDFYGWFPKDVHDYALIHFTDFLYK